MKNSTCVVVPFPTQSGTSQEEASAVFPDLCGKGLEVTPALKRTMAIAFSGFGVNVDAIKTHSQLFQAGHQTLRNPPHFVSSVEFVRSEATRLNALARLLSDVQHSLTKDRSGMPAQLRTEALRDIADGKPISPERYSRLIRLSRFDVISNVGIKA
ncbi:hypothetical protein [Pseudomonas baetica]|uniref:hypothetical protein n=1 Tax=Pseudomonas baetica TaxID=674054 RepID=UPI00240511DF|nr:hypothetical protein [Pseudomonas baetica]MDF9778943.1 hypothetical protein [Pseudomonas baetica]